MITNITAPNRTALSTVLLKELKERIRTTAPKARKDASNPVCRVMYVVERDKNEDEIFPVIGEYFDEPTIDRGKKGDLRLDRDYVYCVREFSIEEVFVAVSFTPPKLAIKLVSAFDAVVFDNVGSWEDARQYVQENADRFEWVIIGDIKEQS